MDGHGENNPGYFLWDPREVDANGFIVAIASVWYRGISIDCGCFGGGGEVDASQTQYPAEIARDLGLLLAVGATVVTTVPAVGTILSVALLSVPALTARLVTDRVGPAMVVGAGFGAASGLLGLTASAEWDYAAGACIALASAVLFFATFVVVGATRRGTRHRAVRRLTPAATPA